SGQGYEVRFEVPAGPIDAAWAERCAEAFHVAHEKEYGQRFDTAIEIVNVRVAGVGLVPPLDWPETAPAEGAPEPRSRGEVVFDVDGRPERLETPFYDRGDLGRGHVIEGPSVVVQYDSTTVVPPGLRAEIDRHGNIVVDCTLVRRSGE